jgi:hypothetical protein
MPIAENCICVQCVQITDMFCRCIDVKYVLLIYRKRLSNAPVLSIRVVMQFVDERRVICSSTASASQFSGDSVVGGGVCSGRLVAEQVLPVKRGGTH